MSAAILSRSVRSSRLSMPRSPSSPATWWATYDWTRRMKCLDTLFAAAVASTRASYPRH